MTTQECIEKIKTFTEFEDGGIKTTYRGGGSYDQYRVYANNHEVAYLTTRDGKNLHTRYISEPTDPFAAHVASELRKVYPVK